MENLSQEKLLQSDSQNNNQESVSNKDKSNQEKVQEKIIEDEEEEESEIDEQYESLKRSKFKQQTYPAWRPKPTIVSIPVTFVVFGFLFIFGGVVLNILSKTSIEIIKEYTDDSSSLGNKSTIYFQLDKDYEGTFLVSYELSKFYQSNRLFMKSKSDKQLKGEDLKRSQLKDCGKLITNGQMGKNESVDGSPLNKEDIAIPCGAFAMSFFNDSYNITNEDTGENIYINETHICWENDLELFDNLKDPNWKKRQWVDMKNEHFINWMRPAPYQKLRKTWGRINGTLKKGNYKVTVLNYFDAKKYRTKKYFVLGTFNALGVRNNFIGITYLVVGGISLCVAFIVVLVYFLYQRSKKQSDDNDRINLENSDTSSVPMNEIKNTINHLEGMKEI